MKTRVVHCKRHSYDVYIGRPSDWGNPFVIGKDGSRQEVLSKYQQWIATQAELLNRISELKGKTLGCWCANKPLTANDQPWVCHGQILAYLAEQR